MTINAIIPYYGSNRMGADKIGEALEGCNWVGIPFWGSGCEAKYITARTIVANDIHTHSINLALVVSQRETLNHLLRRLKPKLFHAAVLAHAQEQCEYFALVDSEVKLTQDERVSWAEAYFVCVWMTRSELAGTKKEFEGKLSIRYNATGGDSVVRFRNAARGLVYWQRTLEKVTFSAGDGFAFLERLRKYDDKPRGHGIYLDPPFPGPGDKYKHPFDEKQHAMLRQVVYRFKHTRIVFRYYDHPLIRTYYPETEWTWICWDGRKSSNEKAPEVILVRNNDPT